MPAIPTLIFLAEKAMEFGLGDMIIAAFGGGGAGYGLKVLLDWSKNTPPQNQVPATKPANEISNTSSHINAELNQQTRLNQSSQKLVEDVKASESSVMNSKIILEEGARFIDAQKQQQEILILQLTGMIAEHFGSTHPIEEKLNELKRILEANPPIQLINELKAQNQILKEEIENYQRVIHFLREGEQQSVSKIKP